MLEYLTRASSESGLAQLFEALRALINTPAFHPQSKGNDTSRAAFVNSLLFIYVNVCVGMEKSSPGTYDQIEKVLNGHSVPELLLKGIEEYKLNYSSNTASVHQVSTHHLCLYEQETTASLTHPDTVL